MATGRGGKKIKTRLGFLLYGDYGTWKSSFCLESMKLVNEMVDRSEFFLLIQRTVV